MTRQSILVYIFKTRMPFSYEFRKNPSGTQWIDSATFLQNGGEAHQAKNKKETSA